VKGDVVANAVLRKCFKSGGIAYLVELRNRNPPKRFGEKVVEMLKEKGLKEELKIFQK
jgi:hypothetical protein